MKVLRPLICAFVFVSLPAFNSFGEEEESVIVVSAGKIQQEEDNNVEQVDVISSEKIAESGAKTVSDALRSVPGITVNAVSAANPTESISMQGLSSEYVKIMIDGVSVSGDVDGNVPVFQLPVENIERIEVISGSSSVLYGSDAMGGAINIITKKNEADFDQLKFNLALTQEGGISPSTLNWRDYSAATASLSSGRFSSSLTASIDYTPGKEKYTNDALAGKIKYYESTKKQLDFLRASADWTDDWGKIGAYGLYTDSSQICNYTKTGYDKGSTMEYTSSRMEGGITGKYIYDNNLSFNYFSAVKYYYLDTVYSVAAGSNSSTKGTETDFIEWESDVRATLLAGDYNEILFGLNADVETIDGDSFDERKKALAFAAFAQDTLSLADGKVKILPGARLDYAPSVQGSGTIVQATPKLSLRYDPCESLVLKCSYGMGYKLPSLKQKYWVFRHNYAPGAGNFILYGNDDLDPEKSHGFNASIDKNFDNIFKLGISGYFNYLIDMIDSVVIDATSSPQIREYQNVDKAITYGAELSFSSTLDRFECRAGYVFAKAKAYDSSSDKWNDMGLRSEHRVTASVSYLFPVVETKVALNGEWNSRQLISTGGDDYTPDYLMAGVCLSKKFLEEKLELYLRGDNLLNNLNFKDGSNGDNQKDYYGLYDGFTLTLGGKFKW
ncbi:TonB-dependent siderophore receptor [Treponema sp.]|uniref:TonB-dependent receptor plug domain-containing protein n=1 Tax=Treponema sp. TaxID=166 RepID=UPI0025DFC1F1|nr:TonB-dependent receptor [Treponema sp.]MCR5219061.1 TonB-dependent receptor [Treponema sp.]